MFSSILSSYLSYLILYRRPRSLYILRSSSYYSLSFNISLVALYYSMFRFPYRSSLISFALPMFTVRSLIVFFSLCSYLIIAHSICSFLGVIIVFRRSLLAPLFLCVFSYSTVAAFYLPSYPHYLSFYLSLALIITKTYLYTYLLVQCYISLCFLRSSLISFAFLLFITRSRLLYVPLSLFIVASLPLSLYLLFSLIGFHSN